jgi:hypothetical protein
MFLDLLLSQHICASGLPSNFESIDQFFNTPMSQQNGDRVNSQNGDDLKFK